MPEIFWQYKFYYLISKILRVRKIFKAIQKLSSTDYGIKNYPIFKFFGCYKDNKYLLS